MKQDCPAFIYVRLNDNGTKLEVSKTNDAHNHTSEVLFSNQPDQRRLAPQMKSEIVEYMEIKTNKKLIWDKIQNKTGKVVTQTLERPF